MNKFTLMWLLAFILIVVLWLVSRNKKSKEGYGFVMGAMGSRRNEYYNCISECEREDLSKKLGPTHGNLYCAEYCDSKLTDKILSGEPTYNIATQFDYCNAVCGKDGDGKFCREQCHCDYEVGEKCRQECAYSNAPVDWCLTECKKSKSPNCNTLSWNFK